MGILDNLPHRATAMIRTRTLDAYGGAIDSYSIVFADRPCWRQKVSESETQDFQKRGIYVTDKFYFTSDPLLDERHILEVGDKTYEVVTASDPDASAGLGVVYRVIGFLYTSGGSPS